MDRRALVALGLGLAVFLGLLWLSGRGGEALRSEEPAGAGSAIEDEGPHLTAPLARSSEALRRERGTPPRVPRDARVLVRSDLGLPLERVELEDGEAWREVVLEEGALSVPFAARPTRVRAPGHQAAEVESETKALTLAPHASLVLEAFPVERLERQDPFRDWPERAETGRRFLLAGPRDATSWAIALDPTRLRSLFPDLDMTFEFDDGSAALVTHELAADRHDVYRWPLAPEAVGRERLRVEIARAPESTGELEVVLRADPNRVAPPGKRSRWNEATPWGRVVILDYLEQYERRTAASEVEFPEIVLGKAYLLHARDLESGDHHRLFFVHDGSDRSLALDHGLRVRGRLDPSPALLPRRLERIVWRFGRDEETGWRGETRDVPLDREGAFDLALPDVVAISKRRAFPRPEGLTLELRAGGFARLVLQRETAGRRELDLGTLRLEALPTQIVLAPGHGLQAEELGMAEVELPDESGLGFELAGAQTLPEGALALALAEPSRFDSAAFVLTDVPFRRDPDGRYRRVPAREVALRLTVDLPFPDGNRELRVGWEWAGIHHFVRAWREDRIEPQQDLSFPAPIEDVRLEWALQGGSERRGSLPLTDPIVRLRVP